MSPARCPHCETYEVEATSALAPGDAGSDGWLDFTHRCLNLKCAQAFRYTPPDRERQKELRP